MATRESSVIRFKVPTGATESDVVNLGGGCFGTLIVRPGSDAIGKALQFIAVDQDAPSTSPWYFPDTELLGAAKTLAAGANAISSSEINEIGGATSVKIKLDSEVASDTHIILLWKS